jgi:hypothetical protein
MTSRDDLSANERDLRAFINELPLGPHLKTVLIAKLEVTLNEVGYDFGNFLKEICCDECLERVKACLEAPVEEPS